MAQRSIDRINADESCSTSTPPRTRGLSLALNISRTLRNSTRAWYVVNQLWSREWNLFQSECHYRSLLTKAQSTRISAHYPSDFSQNSVGGREFSKASRPTVLDQLAVVIPVYNEAERLQNLLAQLRRFSFGEVIVVDGGSTDSYENLIESERVVHARKGRGNQLRVGVEAAKGDWIWMLHADVMLSNEVVPQLESKLSQAGWGRCDIKIRDKHFLFLCIARLMNVRSSITSICTGDQGIFVHRELLNEIGGMPDQPLMEDIELSRRLKRLQKPIRIKAKVIVSGRKWLREGIVRTILRMWCFRIAYWVGVSPFKLESWYYRDQ